jgi:hypothetical protein
MVASARLPFTGVRGDPSRQLIDTSRRLEQVPSMI